MPQIMASHGKGKEQIWGRKVKLACWAAFSDEGCLFFRAMLQNSQDLPTECGEGGWGGDTFPKHFDHL